MFGYPNTYIVNFVEISADGPKNSRTRSHSSYITIREIGAQKKKKRSESVLCNTRG